MPLQRLFPAAMIAAATLAAAAHLGGGGYLLEGAWFQRADTARFNLNLALRG